MQDSRENFGGNFDESRRAQGIYADGPLPRIVVRAMMQQRFDHDE